MWRGRGNNFTCIKEVWNQLHFSWDHGNDEHEQTAHKFLQNSENLNPQQLPTVYDYSLDDMEQQEWRESKSASAVASFMRSFITEFNQAQGPTREGYHRTSRDGHHRQWESITINTKFGRLQICYNT